MEGSEGVREGVMRRRCSEWTRKHPVLVPHSLSLIRREVYPYRTCNEEPEPKEDSGLGGDIIGASQENFQIVSSIQSEAEVVKLHIGDVHVEGQAFIEPTS